MLNFNNNLPFLLTLMYAVNLFAAGVPGFFTLFFNKQFFKESQGYTSRILGAIWLTIAVCSLLGIFYPLTFLPVLFMQIIYKSIWLLHSGFKILMSRKTSPDFIGVFSVFVFIIVFWILFLPFGLLFKG